MSDYSVLKSKLRFKYGIDKAVAGLLIILMSPVFAMLALLIKLDGCMHPSSRGRVFYKETRMSAGHAFEIIKFRTVTEDAIRWIGEDSTDRSITANKSTTWAGRIILKWYLDELPQLLNIWKGDMSFVGPRPHILLHHESDIRSGCIYRNYMRAGLLGVVQACKRHPKYEEIFKHMANKHRSSDDALNSLDGLYARRCLTSSSLGLLWFDITLIMRGLIVVFRGSTEA